MVDLIQQARIDRLEQTVLKLVTVMHQEKKSIGAGFAETAEVWNQKSEDLQEAVDNMRILNEEGDDDEIFDDEWDEESEQDDEEEESDD